MSSNMILVPLAAAEKFAESVERWAKARTVALVMLFFGMVLVSLACLSLISPELGVWATLLSGGVAGIGASWVFKKAGDLRGHAGTIRITFSDLDSMREAGVPAIWISKLEQADVLLGTQEERKAYMMASQAVAKARS